MALIYSPFIHFQFIDIKNCRRFAHMMIIKRLYQLRKREDLAVICGITSQAEPHSLHYSLCQKALIDEVFIRRMTASLGKLLVLLVGDQRTMAVY